MRSGEDKALPISDSCSVSSRLSFKEVNLKDSYSLDMGGSFSFNR